MRKFVCIVCGYLYDEATDTLWEELPEDWCCPNCGVPKTEFRQQDAPREEEPPPKSASAAPAVAGDLGERSPLEVSALCSNLARGCEKQYHPREAALFTELADYFKSVAPPAETPAFADLDRHLDDDLGEYFPQAKAAATQAGDRGALRALVWSEKVSRVSKSLLTRYQREGEALVENTGVFVCSICGFIYTGEALPEVCPVCKVPNWKFEKIEGR